MAQFALINAGGVTEFCAEFFALSILMRSRAVQKCPSHNFMKCETPADRPLRNSSFSLNLRI